MKLSSIYENNLNELYNLYFSIHEYKLKKQHFYISKFFLYIHKKLHYYNITINDKQFIISNGLLLRVRTKLTKFFKKSRKSYGASITALNKVLKKRLFKINLFYCKNFNYKNYLWLKKFISLIKPTVNYFIVTKGWNYLHKHKRRIKKKIYRNLLKQSFLV